MRHKLKIGISRDAPKGTVMACTKATVSARLMERLFGPRCRVAIIVPGDSVEDVTITEADKEGGEGEGHGKDE